MTSEAKVMEDSRYGSFLVLCSWHLPAKYHLLRGAKIRGTSACGEGLEREPTSRAERSLTPMTNQICPWKARRVGVPVDRCFEDSSCRVEQQSYLSTVYRGDGCSWMNASIEQYFIGIDVSDPRHHTLVHQDAFDGALPLAQPFLIRLEINP